MTDAIIGSTEFVGANLLGQHEFSGQFHSRNIAEIDGERYDLIVCAAAPATMWAANKDPEGDLRNIRALISHLERVQAEHFVLISTIAVLANAAAALDETTEDFEVAKAYGRNRRFLEESVRVIFPRAHVLRLPALFGNGLKKNFIFDILNPVPSFLTRDKYDELRGVLPARAVAVLENVYAFAPDLGMFRCDRDRLVGEDGAQLTAALFAAGFTALNFTNADSTFQYYSLARLWSDIGVVIANDVPLVHLAPEPLRAGDIFEALTGTNFAERTAPLYHENMCTLHAGLWKNSGRYIQDGTSVMHELARFHAASARP